MASGNNYQKLLVQRLTFRATIPTRVTPQAAGWDLYSAKHVHIRPKGRAICYLDLAIQVPKGTYGRIAPRSGLSLLYGIHVGAGVIDRDFRGNVGVVLYNLGDFDFRVRPGDKIAQLICEKYAEAEIEETDWLSDTNRGPLGFGSSGMR
jgi:dUTP pyrophosphatase